MSGMKEEASIRVRKQNKFKPNIAEMLQASIVETDENNTDHSPMKRTPQPYKGEETHQSFGFKKITPSPKFPGATVRPITEQKPKKSYSATGNEFFQPKKRLP